MNDERFKPGDVFQAYTMQRCVGVGGVSVVWAAQHNFLGYEVAIKILQVRHVNNPRMVELAKAEAIALSRLRHVNLVEVRDAGITPDGTVWMAMPLLEGLTLRDYLLQHGRLPILDALRFARDICDGARAAHEVGIVHRDLKPENTFLTTPRLELVVLDLGMAKFQDLGLQSTGEGKSAMGTVRYMSPEHVSSRKVDHRTDQYAIGVMLYEMLWEHPYLRGEDGEVLDNYHIGLAHTIREPRPLTEVMPGFPPYIWEVIKRAMAKDRNDRFPSTLELAQAIRAVRKRYAAEMAEAPQQVASQPGAEHAYLSPRPTPQGGLQPEPAPSAKVVAPAGAWTAPPNAPAGLPVKTMFLPEMSQAPQAPALPFAPAASGTAVPAVLSHAPTMPVPRHPGEATPPPSTSEPQGPKPRSVAPFVIGAIAIGAVLTAVLQFGLRDRGEASGSPSASAVAAAESAPAVTATPAPAPEPAPVAASAPPPEAAAPPEPPPVATTTPATKPPPPATAAAAPAAPTAIPKKPPATATAPAVIAKPSAAPKAEALPKSGL